MVIIQKHIRFVITYIYGFNCYIQRRNLWQSISDIASGMGSSPWLTLGDFNVVRYCSKKLGGDQSWPNYLEEFNECCRTSFIDDLRYTGQLTTWSKGYGSKFLARKLDRTLVNPMWHNVFPEAEAFFQEPGASDHSPILVSLGLQLHIRRPSFRYFTFWREHPSFEGVVSAAWASTMDGSPQFCFAKKLKILKSTLKSLNKIEFTNLSDKTQELELLCYRYRMPCC